MKRIAWYFDFISPFAYLQSEQLDRLRAHAVVQARPLLFAGLLKHWGNVGPAELPTKRIWTFEHCAWIAHRESIPLVLPPVHPFNPLPLLRAAAALAVDGVVPDAIMHRLFRFVWQQGQLPGDNAAWADLLSELGLTEESLKADAVKDVLRRNGENAIAAGIFGVPTALVDGLQFWGLDATDMLLAYLAGDAFFAGPAIKAARELAPGLQRAR